MKDDLHRKRVARPTSCFWMSLSGHRNKTREWIRLKMRWNRSECPSLKLLWIDRLLKVGTGVGGELFVALGFVSLLHLVKRRADEGTSRMEYPLTLGASEPHKVRALNPDQTARHCRIISQNNACSGPERKRFTFRGRSSATSVFTTEQTRVFTASIILLGWKPCGGNSTIQTNDMPD